jgi:exopolyphosphatase / guanosine-5'-triphosphate,3'-diphosphate pyrophosphatase
MAQRTASPRWEWRAFGEAVGGAAERLAALAPDGVGESEDLYLLSREDSDTVKVRDGLMDVKHLEEVDDRGLERWRPVMKAAFPLDAADVRAVWAALGVPAPPLGRAAYELDRILGEVVDPEAIRAVTVHKRRRQYTLGGSTVELTDVRTDRGTTRTVAVESEDPARVMATVRELGVDAAPNTSYPRALRELVRFGGRRGAAIDVGTNSVKFCVGERSDGGGWRTVVDRAAVTRLGEGLHATGELGPAPMARTIDAICDMARQARTAGALDIAAVGTAGLRMAANGAAFVEAVRARCGVRVEIISGEEEGRLGYLAVRPLVGRDGGTVVVFETGGGSSQFTFGHGDRVDERFSLDVGAVALTERHHLDREVSPAAVETVVAAIRAELTRLARRPPPDRLIGMGGAFTNLAAVTHELAVYMPDVVEGTVLDRAEIDRQIDLYRTRSAEERRGIVGLQPARAEVILAGACIVRAVLDTLGSETVTVTDRGIRHGLLTELLGGEAGEGGSPT